MPTKSNGRGTFLIEKSYRGLKKPIRRASGTNRPKTYRLILAMLDNLYELGRLDLLESIQLGELQPLELFARYRLGAFDRLPTTAGIRDLRRSAREFADNRGCSESHRKNIRHYLSGSATTDKDGNVAWRDGVILAGAV